MEISVKGFVMLMELGGNVSMQVRVFTYLIGREMTFAQNTKWIACNNKGEFV